MPRKQREDDNDVGFLFETMRNRDPGKRKVKPVPHHLIQTHFGLDDSENDSDFEANISDCSEGERQILQEISENEAKSDSFKNSNDDAEASKSEDDSTEDDSSDDDSDSSEQDSDSDSDSDESETDVDEKKNYFDAIDSDDDEDYVPKKKQKVDKQHVEKQRIKSPEVVKASSPTTEPTDSRPMKVLICCVCLGDISETDDEIVECDNCGVAVHEGCYGICDNQSNASTESSASTEPWFCDACKAGVKPTCELCPNEGGIFKETDAGKWVHLVCALYTPGVAFGDVDKLSPVTLFEMPYSKWGAKECSLCEDLRFSRTGVCVSCDAGMCRSFFHVTCAQRNGLLSEASPEEVQDIADPFFAYCKLHADKLTSRAKRRNYLAIQSHIRQHAVADIQDEKEKARFVRKLNVHRQKYKIAKANRPPSWGHDMRDYVAKDKHDKTVITLDTKPIYDNFTSVPPKKMIRYLTSSPSVVKKMLRKAELMGIITQSQHEIHNQDKQERKKSHIGPALSAEFVNYYLDRNIRIDKIKSDLREHQKQKEKLQQQNNALRLQYDQMLKESNKIQETADRLTEVGEQLWEMLSDMAGRPLSPPPVLRQRSVTRAPTQKESPQAKSTVINQCGICGLSHDQHLLARCDKCHLWYHLGCLDPPLTRMPKKTSRMGWQCSECADTSSDSSEEKTTVNVNAPRRLRDKIKEPAKFTRAQEDMEFLFPSFKKQVGQKKKPTVRTRREKRSLKREQIKDEPAEDYSILNEEESDVWQVYDVDNTSPTGPRSGTPASVVNISDESSIEVEVKIEEQRTPIPKEHPHFQDVSRTGRKIIKKKHYDENSGDSDISPKQASPGKKSSVEKERSKPQEVKHTARKLLGSNCVTCSKPGTKSNMVSCDRCEQFYHFGCLNPPFKHTPKPRGYTWFCEACDSSDSSEDEEVIS